MGRKELKGGSGITPQQVSAKVMSSVLIIPEGIESYKLNKALVPVDFSEYSSLALEQTLYLKSLKSDLEIKCHHIYNLPLGYEKTGKTANEFSEIMRENAEKKFKKMQKKIEGAASLECNFVLSDENSIGKQIKDAADKENANLIVMGAKGRTLATQIFLGSATEKLIKFQSNSALLVVKDKSSIFDFWKFFESI
jgi:nucleotide-binding universal stress UspA family protein